MALYIVQHGLSLPAEADPERGLSEEGGEEVRRMARKAAGFGIKPQAIVHSGKKRARQTAEILARYLKPESVSQIDGIGPKDNVFQFAQSLQNKTSLMIVGHMPFLGQLVSYLILGKTEPEVFRLQNSGILCKDIFDREWVINWALMPKME